MASVKLIRGRIKSAKNIAQITRAMEMVSASKMKKAIEAASLGKSYAEKIYEATRSLAGKTDARVHPLLSKGNPNGKTLLIIISTNKGLCGGLNTNLFREVQQKFGSLTGVECISVGKKGESFVIKSGRKLVADYSVVPFESSVAPLTQYLVEGFVQGTYKQVYVIFNSFINALKQLPMIKQILPLSATELVADKEAPKTEEFAAFEIEPNVEDVLGALLPHYLENQIRAAIFESEASEHSARMIAMKNATDAALDLMENLTLVYNKIRQEKITYEIADTVTARMAME